MSNLKQQILQSLPAYLSDLDPGYYYRPGNVVVVDFETTVKNYGDSGDPENHIVLACWCVVDNLSGKVLRTGSTWGDEYEQANLANELSQALYFVAQNAKFEYGWIRRMGLDSGELFSWDTMLYRKVELGNLPGRMDLNGIAEHEKLGILKDDYVNGMIKGGADIHDIPPTKLEYYCHLDIELTYRAWRKQWERARATTLLPTFYTRMLMTPVLADMEFKGMMLDKQAVLDEYREQCEIYATLEAELNEMTGGINFNSTDQVAKYLYEDLGFAELKRGTGPRAVPIRGPASKKWPEGKPKTDAKTLAKLKATTQKQRRFLELKAEVAKAQALLTKALKPFMQVIEGDGDNILRFNFNQHVTATHRLSSNGKSTTIQGQNIPRDYKRMFKARTPGWRIGETDYAKLEFVTAAFLGKDPVALADVDNDFDVHRYSAAVMKVAAEIPDAAEKIQQVMELAVARMDRIDKKERTAAKPDTFGPLFGKVKGTPAQEAYFTAFRSKYRVLDEEQKRWIESVLGAKDKGLTLCTGMRFYYPYAKMNRHGYVDESTSIRNHPIQSLATAEIVPVGVVYTWHAMRALNLESFLINTIHDSIVTEVKPDEEDLIREIHEVTLIELVIEYLAKVYGLDFDALLEAEVGFGDAWSKNDTDIKVGRKYYEQRKSAGDK